MLIMVMGIIKKFLQDHQKTKRDNQIHSMKKVHKLRQQLFYVVVKVLDWVI